MIDLGPAGSRVVHRDDCAKVIYSPLAECTCEPHEVDAAVARRAGATAPPPLDGLASLGDVISASKLMADLDPAAMRALAYDRSPPAAPDGTPAAAADPYRRRPIVPAKHAGSRFDNFDPMRAGREHAKSLALALSAAERWTKAAIERRPAMLAIVGPPGNGKSHLLYAAAHALTEARVEAWCRPWYRLADELRFGGALPWRRHDDAAPRLDGYVLRDRMFESRVILLDEVRGTSGTDFDGNELAKLASHAYDEGAALLITTNVHPLAAIMGPAPADRFAVVQITAPSQRGA